MFPQSPITSGKKRKTRTMDIGSPGMKTLGRQSKRHLSDREKSGTFSKKRASMIAPSLDHENQSNNSPSRYQKRHSISGGAFPPGLEETFGVSAGNKTNGISLPPVPPLSAPKQTGRDLMTELEKAKQRDTAPSPQISALPPKLSTSLPASIASPLPAPLSSPTITPSTPSSLPASIASPLPAPLASPSITPLPPPISSLPNASPLPSPLASPSRTTSFNAVPQSPLPAPLSLDVPPSPSKPPTSQPSRITGTNTAPMLPPSTTTNENPSAHSLRKRRGSCPGNPTLSMMGGVPVFQLPPATPSSSSSSSDRVTPKPKLPPLPAVAGSSEASPAEAKRLRKLTRAKNELYDTEKTYHDILHSLVHEFLFPLRELGIPNNHLDKLFGNVVELYNISTDFLAHFEAWVKGEVPSLCQVFEEKGKDLLNAMITYCDRFSFLQQRNFKLIVEGVDASNPNGPVDHAYKKTSAAITGFLKSKKVQAVDLNSKLVVPCQRVMRYRMLVEEIKKNSCVNKDREMWNDLQTLTAVTQMIADEVNKYMSKLARKHKCHSITEEFAARFENGEEFVVTMENDLAAIQEEADVVILEPDTAYDFDNDDGVSFQYPTRQLTGKLSRPVYLLKSGVSSKCVLEETKEHVALLGSKMVRATGGKKNMTIEEIVSLDYAFYVRGEEDTHLHILTPYSDFVIQFGSEGELMGWTAAMDRMFEELEEKVKRKRKRHARRIAFYRFGGCMVGGKSVNRPFMLVWMDFDDSDVPYPSECGLQNVKRRVRGGEKGGSTGAWEEEEEEDVNMDDNEIEVIRSPVRKSSIPGSPLPGSPATRPGTPQQRQQQKMEEMGEGGEDPSVVAMYAQLRLIEEQHKKNPMGNYKAAIALSRVAIINRKKMLMEFDGANVSFTEEEKEWEKDMVEEEGGMGGGGNVGTPKFKRFLPKCNMPKASPSLKRVRKGW